MSYGNKNKYDANGTMIFFSPRSKDRDKKKVSPYFAISRIVDGKIKQTDETATEVGGKLFKISLKNRVYEGVENKEATLYLKDDKANEVYVLPLSFRMDSRSLFNALINLENFDDLNISLYETRKGFSAYYPTQNGKRVDWKYKLEELPEPTKVKFKGKDMNDWTVLDDFYEKELLALASRLSGKEEATEASNTPTTENKAQTVAPDADVPF